MPTITRLGRYKLRARPDAGSFEVAWTDDHGRQRRAALGTRDLPGAEQAFARWVAVEGEVKEAAPALMPLAQVFLRYHELHASRLPSAAEQRRHLAYWLEHFGEARVDQAGVTAQERFVAALVDKGYSSGYVKRILATGAAALRWSYRRGELASIPHVVTVPDSLPRERIFQRAELVAFWDAIEDDELARWVMLMLNTGCRPGAAFELMSDQVDLARRRIDLNQRGRTRTKKGRPIVPITMALLPWLKLEAGAKLVRRGEKQLGLAWRAARARAGLPAELVPYSLRHTVATELDEAGCDENQISAFMGWRSATRMRDWYTKRRAYRPTYCSEIVAALEAMFAELAAAQKAEGPVCNHRPFIPITSTPRASSVPSVRKSIGAGEGIRTLDPNLGKVVLYP